MFLLALVLLSLGGLVAAFCGVWLVALGFQRHLLWGLAVLLVPLGALAFSVRRWREAQAPFLLGTFSLLMMVSALLAVPSELCRHPSRLFAEITGRRSGAEQAALDREILAAQQEAEAQLHLVHLQQREKVLRARRAQLTQGQARDTSELRAHIARYNAEVEEAVQRGQWVTR